MAKRKRRNFTPSLKRQLFLRHSAVKVHKFPNSVGGEPNLSADQLSKWKQQLLENVVSVFTSSDKHSSEAAEGIAHLEQLVGRLTVALDIQKSLDVVELTPSEQCQIVEALRTDDSVRQICEPLGFTRSNLYYQPKKAL